MSRRAFIAVVAVTLGLATAGAAAAQSAIAPPKPYEPVDRNGVDLSSGGFTTALAPLAIGPAGQGGLSVSVKSDGGGYGWTHDLYGGVNQEPRFGQGSDYAVYSVSVLGMAATFLDRGDDTYVLRDGLGKLEKISGGFVYTAPDGTAATFDGDLLNTFPISANRGQVTSVVRPNGERIEFHYNGGMQLRAVTNNYGYQVHFDYSTTQANRIDRITAFNMAVDSCSPTAATCTYSRVWPSLSFAQTTSGSTVTERSATDALGRVTRLIYTGGRVTGVARPTKTTGQNITIAWDTAGRVTSVDDGAGTYAYDTPPGGKVGDIIIPETVSTVTDPLGHETQYHFEWFNQGDLTDAYAASLQGVTDANGLYTEIVQGGAGLGRVTYPEGNGLQVDRNDNGNVTRIRRWAKPGSGLADTTVTATYPATCATLVLCRLPTSITDARGHVTDYTYDAAGNLLTATAPAPTPGAVRPQTRYVWQQKYAWYKQDGSSAVTRAATPVWVQVEQSACATGTSCTSGSALAAPSIDPFAVEVAEATAAPEE